MILLTNKRLYLQTMPGKLSLVFATNNQHKLKEIKSMIPDSISILSLKDIGCLDELPETSATLRGNALQKAKYVFDKYGMNCFADDTGLEIESLNGRPGVYSARYAGLNSSYDDNVSKVLNEMKGIENRKAKFKTVIALLTDRVEKCFEGIVEGEISINKRGDKGFGYDPVFLPAGSDKTFAEMTEAEKNKISHRARALDKLISFFEEVNVTDENSGVK
jgi:XTP/dITP diphosphohydrolase